MTGCRISNFVVDGSQAKWNIRCESPAGPMTGSGKARTNGREVVGSVQLSLATFGGFEVPVAGTFKASRTGACPAAPGTRRSATPSKTAS